MAFFSSVGNEAQYQKYDNATSGLTATNTQDAIDEVSASVDGLVDDAVQIDTDATTTTFTLLAEYNSPSVGDCLVGSVQPTTEGNNGDWYFNTTGVGGYTLWEKISGSWVGGGSLGGGANFQNGTFNEANAISYANGNPGGNYIVVLTNNPPAVDGDMYQVYQINRNVPVVQGGDIIVWNGMGQEWYTTSNDANMVTYNNGTSGLDAVWVQDAVDELADEKLNTPGFIIWEPLDWRTLINGAGAPTSSTGGPDWFYLDTTSGSEELYGPASFDPGIPGWDWGSPLANFTFSTTGPTSEAGDWYVWDDGSTFILFQKKTAVNYGDMLFWSGWQWEARSGQIRATNVFQDLSGINTAYGVDNVGTQLFNLYSTYGQAYNGGNSFFIEADIDTTYTVNPFDGNGFILTLEDDTTISFSANWDPTSQLGTRFCELTIVLKQDATGGWITTWDSNVKVSSGTTLTTTADAVDMLKAVSWDNGTTWYVTQIGADFA